MQTGSHVREIVECLRFVRESRERETSLQEVTFEIEVRLCELMQRMLTGPLTGQMFVPLPAEFLSETEIEKSLADQTTV